MRKIYTEMDAINAVAGLFNMSKPDIRRVVEELKKHKRMHGGPSIRQHTRTRFSIAGITGDLGITPHSDIVYVELDKSRDKSLENYIKRAHSRRYNYFEFEETDDAVFAVD